MAITFISGLSQKVQAGETGSLVNITVPSGVTNTHLAVAIVATDRSYTNGHAPNITGFTRHVNNPSQGNNSEVAFFSRLGGMTSGQTLNFTSTNGTPIARLYIAWYDTQGRGIAIVGSPGGRTNGGSDDEIAVPGITTTYANQEIIIMASERTTTDGTDYWGSDPIDLDPPDFYREDYSNTNTSGLFANFTKATAGATGTYWLYYSDASSSGVGMMVGIAAPVPPPAAAKLATFTDQFTTGIDTNVWEISPGIAASAGGMSIPVSVTSSAARLYTSYDLNGSSVSAKMVPPTRTPTVGTESWFILADEGSRYSLDNSMGVVVREFQVYSFVRAGGAYFEAALGTWGNTTFGSYWRLRHVTGTSYAMDSSVDGSIWVQRANYNITTWSPTRVVIIFMGGGSQPDTAGYTAYVDNINFIPPVPVVTTILQTDMSATSLSLGWTTTNAANVRVFLSENASLSPSQPSNDITPSLSGLITHRWFDLTPNTLYYFGIELNGVLSANGRGQFKTLKSGLDSAKVVASSNQSDGSNPAVFTQIKTEAPDFFAHLGNLHYASTNDEPTWRTAFRAAIEGVNMRSMLSTVNVTYDWSEYDSGGLGSSKDDGWATFAPVAVRQLTSSGIYPDPKALYRTWTHAGVRYIELDRYTYRDWQSLANSPTKTMLGTVQRDWFVSLLTNSTEPAIIVFDGYPHYPGNIVQNGRWGSYPDETNYISDAIAALPFSQKNKIVVIGANSNAIHADDGTNVFWGVPDLCASPLSQTPGTPGLGTWNIGNLAVTAGRGYYSRLTWTYNQAISQLNLVWDAVQDDGTVMLTWSKTFTTSTVTRTGYYKDPTDPSGRRPFIKRRKPEPFTVPTEDLGDPTPPDVESIPVYPSPALLPSPKLYPGA